MIGIDDLGWLFQPVICNLSTTQRTGRKCISKGLNMGGEPKTERAMTSSFLNYFFKINYLSDSDQSEISKLIPDCRLLYCTLVLGYYLGVNISRL
jgi:hypothetical protein